MSITPMSFAQRHGIGFVELGSRGTEYVITCLGKGLTLFRLLAASVAPDAESFTFVPSPGDLVSDDLIEGDLPGTGAGVAFYELPTAFLAEMASEQNLILIAEARMLFPDRNPHAGEPIDREFTRGGQIYVYAQPPISASQAENVIDWAQCWATNAVLTRAAPQLSLPRRRAEIDEQALRLIVAGAVMVASSAFDSMGLIFAGIAQPASGSAPGGVLRARGDV